MSLLHSGPFGSMFFLCVAIPPLPGPLFEHAQGSSCGSSPNLRSQVLAATLGSLVKRMVAAQFKADVDASLVGEGDVVEACCWSIFLTVLVPGRGHIGMHDILQRR